MVKLAGWKFRRIGEGFASTFQSRHPGKYMYQEVYITRNFFPVGKLKENLNIISRTMAN
jgi:hypothetical protein